MKREMTSPHRRGFCRLALLIAVFVTSKVAYADSTVGGRYDVVVYGGTPAAITAAIEVERMGMKVVLVCPDTHLGGMTSSGLGWIDSKNGNAIGGLAREFFHRVWQHYQKPDAWNRNDRAAYAARVFAQPGKTIDDEKQVMWTLEPHVAEDIFKAWLKETHVEIHQNEWLDRKDGVEILNHDIRQIKMLSGRIYTAKIFIDATYEGDLMAAAGISYRVGRDSATEYAEPLNGIYFRKPEDPHFKASAYEGVDPYVVSGSATSGLLPGIEGEFPANEHEGDADGRLQSFNFRLCMTTVLENRIPIKEPKDYKESNYELLLRLYEANLTSGFSNQEMPNGKTDANNLGLMSLDDIGGNFSIREGWNYSEADYDTRKQIIQKHRDYTQGLLWTLMNNPRVPEKHRLNWSRYGLSADEFTDMDHWPFQIYVREARRMVGQFMMTQHHVQRKPGYEITDSIGLGSYSLDSHVIRRIVRNGKIENEGGFYLIVDQPYPISAGVIEPRKGEATNLLDPVTLSATHAAFGSIRMEPTYMILGQSAGALAALAAKANIPVQDVPYSDLRSKLIADGQILDMPSPK